MTSRSCSKASALLALASFVPLSAQINSLSSVLSVTPPQNITVRKNSTAAVDLKVELRNGFHVNSDKPSDPYLIPLRLTWNPSPVQPSPVTFPQPKMEKFEFSDKPLSVFEGMFKLTSQVKIPANTPPGPLKLTGKLRYQACNNKMCLPPRTVDVAVPLTVQP